MKCYEGHILTVNQNNDVVRYLVEDGGKIVYVGNDLPGQYRAAVQEVVLAAPDYSKAQNL